MIGLKPIKIDKDGAFFYNTKIKLYADGTKKLKITTYDVKTNLKKEKRVGETTQEDKEYSRYKNLYHSKQKLIDLVYHNSLIQPWQYFVTLTFDDNIVNAKNYEEVSTTLKKWLDNLRHQNKGMQYIIVPEPHKSGRIHYHGLFSNVPCLELKEARGKNGRCIYKNGSQIFNIENYDYGFTTVSEIKNQEAVSVYMAKYMTKSLIDLNYKKRYWSSRNLSRPNLQYAVLDLDTLKFFIQENKLDVNFEGKKSFYVTSYNV